MVGYLASIEDKLGSSCQALCDNHEVLQRRASELQGKAQEVSSLLGAQVDIE